MRVSQFFISTLKEAPAEAELVSHRLMLRAGLIRKLGSGLYTWMPLGLRVLRKVESRRARGNERSGAVELSMPAVQPAELWQESGRWEVFGPQMLKIKDRHERDFCFGPTHEEVITDIARREIRSYRQLPVNFYQIQTKFRDEIRPRFGVMRAREFVMKDAYSFHIDLRGPRTRRTAICTTPTRASSRASGWIPRGGGRHRRHRRHRLARVPRARRLRRGRDRLLPRFRLRRQRRAGRGARAVEPASRAWRSRCRKSPRRTRTPSRR